MKKCFKCKEQKEDINFHNDKDSKDGLFSWCKECTNENKRRLRKKPDYIQREKEYEERTKDRRNELKKINRQKIEYKEVRNRRERERRANDPIYRFNIRIRSSILKSIRNGGFSKKTNTYNILGCAYEDFLIYIEGKFENWMNWQNRGLYNGKFNYGWDLDHIIPISSSSTEEEIIKLNHYTNFQPLCSKINRDIKKDNPNYGEIGNT